MRTLNTFKLATAIALAVGVAGVQAATLIPAGFGVSTAVTSTCTFGATGNLAFGPYTSGQLTNVDTTTQVGATCSAGTAYQIALNDGANWGLSTYTSVRALSNGTGGFLAYFLMMNSVAGAQWGDNVHNGGVYSGMGNNAGQLITVAGRIPFGQAAAPGNYTDSVIATLSY